MIELKHHNYFKLHLPIKDYNENDLTEISMEEFSLASDGEWTKNYKPVNPKKDKLAISVYPSILLLIKSQNLSDSEKFKRVNLFIDNLFIEHLLSFDPLHKCTDFIEYHMALYKGDKYEFLKHIKYQILSIIKKINGNSQLEFKKENLEKIVIDWLEMKMESKEKISSILNNGNLIINSNSNSKIENQSIKKDTNQKESNWKKAGVIMTFLSLVIAIIALISTLMT